MCEQNGFQCDMFGYVPEDIPDGGLPPADDSDGKTLDLYYVFWNACMRCSCVLPVAVQSDLSNQILLLPAGRVLQEIAPTSSPR